MASLKLPTRNKPLSSIYTKTKVAFIIPGYTYKPTRREYKKIGEYFREQDITPVGIDIDWKRPIPRNFDDYLKEFLTQVKKHRADEIYVLGFSLGAVAALLTAQKLKPKAIILCSLSPYFQDDWVNLKKPWLAWWKKHYKDIGVLGDKVKGLKTGTYLLVGSKEDRSCLLRAKSAHKLLPQSRLKIVSGAEHKLQHGLYLKAIARIIKGL